MEVYKCEANHIHPAAINCPDGFPAATAVFTDRNDLKGQYLMEYADEWQA